MHDTTTIDDLNRADASPVTAADAAATIDEHARNLQATFEALEAAGRIARGTQPASVYADKAVLALDDATEPELRALLRAHEELLVDTIRSVSYFAEHAQARGLRGREAFRDAYEQLDAARAALTAAIPSS